MAAGKPNAAPASHGEPAVTLDDVEAARRTMTGAIVETDCDWSRTLSEILGCKVWLKFENQQFTASFKERGAVNRLSALSEVEKARGVIAMSAGNHAQGVAYHARRLGIPATIVMPVNTPTVKVVNTRRHGAEVVLTGETVEEAAAFAHEHGRDKGLTFIHPYDDPLVIAGQGSTATATRRLAAGVSRSCWRRWGAFKASAAYASRLRTRAISTPRSSTPSMTTTFFATRCICRCSRVRAACLR
jgi:threonine dehydratase